MREKQQLLGLVDPLSLMIAGRAVVPKNFETSVCLNGVVVVLHPAVTVRAHDDPALFAPSSLVKVCDSTGHPKEVEHPAPKPMQETNADRTRSITHAQTAS